MRPSFVILGLLVLSAIVGIYVSSDPQRSEALSQMYRNAAFTGEARQTALLFLAVLIGGFIVYLTMSRR